MNANYSREKLWHALPSAPKPAGKEISTPIIYGITAKKGEELVQTKHINGDWVKVPNPAVDLMRTNAARRQRVKFSAANAGFMESLNKALAGGEDYPVLSGLLGIGVGLFSAGAGILFSLTTIAASAGKVTQPLRARAGDEIWSMEVVTKGPAVSGTSSFLHVQYYLLVDPFRQGNSHMTSEWVFHERRTELVIT